MTKPVYLYGLLDPITAQVRYVGITHRDRLQTRYKEHLDYYTVGNIRKSDWVRSLRDKGINPTLILLGKGLYPDYGTAGDAERATIAILREIQDPDVLLNIRSGGEARGGADGYIVLPDDKLLKAFELKQQSLTHEEIAIKLDCNSDFIGRILSGKVRSYLKKYWEFNKTKVKTNNFQKRLDDNVGFEIFNLHCIEHMEITDIARHLDVTKQYVLAILAGKTKPNIRRQWESKHGSSRIKLQKKPIPIIDSNGNTFTSLGEVERYYKTKRDTILRSIINGRPSFRLGVQFWYAGGLACKVSVNHANILKTNKPYGGLPSNPTSNN